MNKNISSLSLRIIKTKYHLMHVTTVDPFSFTQLWSHLTPLTGPEWPVTLSKCLCFLSPDQICNELS